MSGPIDLIATAPAGKLQLDGNFIQSEQPVPDMFHATLKSSRGMHAPVSSQKVSVSI
jgi:hypothetical protein